MQRLVGVLSLMLTFMSGCSPSSPSCLSFEREDILEKWFISNESILCSTRRLYEISRCEKPERGVTVANLSSIITPNWLSDDDSPSEYSVSIRGTPPGSLVYFSIKPTDNSSLYYRSSVEESVDGGINICKNILYVRKSDIWREGDGRLGITKDLLMLAALALAIGCFVNGCSQLCMSFMAVLWPLGLLLVRPLSKTTWTGTFLLWLSLLGLAGLLASLAQKYLHQVACTVLGVVSLAAQLFTISSQVRAHFWQWTYGVWLSIGIFFFVVTKVGCTKAGIGLFLMQCVKFTQLLMYWECLYTVSPIEARLRLERVNSHYEKNTCRTNITVMIEVCIGAILATVCLMGILMQVKRCRMREGMRQIRDEERREADLVLLGGE